MPFYLHAIADSPESGQSYPTKDLALADRTDGYTVSFVPTEAERNSWRERELDRQTAGTYVDVPWSGELAGTPETLWHFCHVSLDVPGMIAYTPDDAYGIADRQVRIKPGKYLQKFYPTLTPDEINGYASRVKAYTNALQLATSGDDIARVYCTFDSPRSCMAWKQDEYSGGPKRLAFPWDNHPTRVYGSSDLAIAYIGTLGEDEDHGSIAARAIVWPAKKRYGRIYGDEHTLRHVLETAGYSSGSMSGAKVRAIEDRCGDYLMPYVDGIDYADLCGDVFVLGRGEWQCQNTDGTTSEESHASCGNCGDRCDEDESYCTSCENQRYYCDHCGEDSFDGGDNGHYSEHRGEWRCDDCWESHDCEACGDTLHEYDHSRHEWPASLCSDCEHKTECSDCGEWTDGTVDDRDVCEDCRKCSDCGEVCEQQTDRDDDDRCQDCHDQHEAESRLTPKRPAGTILRLHRVGVDASSPQSQRLAIRNNRGEWIETVDTVSVSPYLALHRTIDSVSYWTLTHKASGLAVTTLLPSDTAGIALARELASLDWSFTDGNAIPYPTKTAAPSIIARYRA